MMVGWWVGSGYLQYNSAQQEEEDRVREVMLRRDAWKSNLNHKISRSEYQRIIFDKFDGPSVRPPFDPCSPHSRHSRLTSLGLICSGQKRSLGFGGVQ
jgi:hypothetical protein